MARPLKYDYAEVARVWHTANDAGSMTADAIAVAFGVTPNNAKNLILKARDLGLIPPSGRPSRKRRKADGAVCKSCGTKFVPAFAPRERPTVDHSRSPVPPADRTPGGAGPNVSARRVLMCDDCEFECEPGSPRFLIRHCIEVHGRPPTQVERTPARTNPTPVTRFPNLKDHH